MPFCKVASTEAVAELVEGLLEKGAPYLSKKHTRAVTAMVKRLSADTQCMIFIAFESMFVEIE